VLEQAVIRETGDSIGVRSIQRALGTPGTVAPLEASPDPLAGYPSTFTEARQAFERAFLARALRESGGKMATAARALGLARSSLYEKCEEYGLDPKTYRS
jgi:DNA-binding NtrC family response regulator